MESRMINASSDGFLGNMTPTKIQEKIEKLAIDLKHSRKEDKWCTNQPRDVKEINSHHQEAQNFELTKGVLLLTKEKATAKKLYGNSLKTDYSTNMFPLLQEDTIAVKVVIGYQQNFQKKI